MKIRDLLVIGGFVVVGVFAYEIYKHLGQEKGLSQENTSTPENGFSPEQHVSPTNVSGPPLFHAEDICEAKKAAVSSMKERHCEAANAVEKSLNTIFKVSEDGPAIAEINENFDKINDDLNDLLK